MKRHNYDLLRVPCGKEHTKVPRGRPACLHLASSRTGGAFPAGAERLRCLACFVCLACSGSHASGRIGLMLKVVCYVCMYVSARARPLYSLPLLARTEGLKTVLASINVEYSKPGLLSLQ